MYEIRFIALIAFSDFFLLPLDIVYHLESIVNAIKRLLLKSVKTSILVGKVLQIN